MDDPARPRDAKFLSFEAVTRNSAVGNARKPAPTGATQANVSKCHALLATAGSLPQGKDGQRVYYGVKDQLRLRYVRAGSQPVGSIGPRPRSVTVLAHIRKHTGCSRRDNAKVADQGILWTDIFKIKISASPVLRDTAFLPVHQVA